MPILKGFDVLQMLLAKANHFAIGFANFTGYISGDDKKYTFELNETMMTGGL
jgi:hypothetical protein